MAPCGFSLSRPWSSATPSDGTVAFTFSAAEFVEPTGYFSPAAGTRNPEGGAARRLAALIPPPHKNQVMFRAAAAWGAGASGCLAAAGGAASTSHHGCAAQASGSRCADADAEPRGQAPVDTLAAAAGADVWC